jgi:hypothetical protein
LSFAARPARVAIITATTLVISLGSLGPGTARADSPSAPGGTVESSDTGACPGFLPGNTGALASPGDLIDNWGPLETEAIAQTEELYGRSSSSDPSSLYATNYARGVTRAFMFADLVKAIDDVAAGQADATEAKEVTAFGQVVQYGRE